MKKYIVVVALISISFVLGNQFIASRENKKIKKTTSKLQEECCRLALEVHHVALSPIMRNVAHLNEIIIDMVVGCVEGDKSSALIASSKQELEKMIVNLTTLKDAIVTFNNHVESFNLKH